MDSHNQELGTVFNSEMDYSPLFDSQITQVQSSGFDIDDYTLSSAVFLGTQRKTVVAKSILPIELGMEEEGNMKCKRLKSVPPAKHCFFVSVPENPSPLGLTLRKTPSFLDLVESKLSHSHASFSMLEKIKSTHSGVSVSQNNQKTKASNFSASLLQIGSWESVSRYDGELVAKCYFAKRKLVWEVLDGGLKKKIEMQWSDIAALRATCEFSAPQTLEIELLKRPLFFRETNPQPRKHTLWKATSDFTDGQASIFRRHLLQLPQGTPLKQLEKLLQLDNRLSLLSKKPYPSLDSALFGADNLESRNLYDHKVIELGGQCSLTSEGFLKSTSSDDYSELLHCLTLTRTTIPQKYSILDQTVTSSGASTNCLSHGTSISTANIIPSVFVSIPSFISDFNSSSSTESYNIQEKSMGGVKTDLLGNNIGTTGLHKGNTSSKFTIKSVLDFEPNYWISESQTNQIFTDSPQNIDYETEMDGYLGRFSYVSDNVEDYGNSVEFSANIYGTTPFPILLVEDDEATSSKVGEAIEWAAWM